MKFSWSATYLDVTVTEVCQFESQSCGNGGVTSPLDHASKNSRPDRGRNDRAISVGSIQT